MIDKALTALLGLAEAVLTPAVLISILPFIVASCMVSVLVHIIRVDNRARKKLEFYPLTLVGIIAAVGFPLGFVTQALLQAGTLWMMELMKVERLPNTGPLVWITCGFFTPFGAWLSHRLVMFVSSWRGTGTLAYKLKVKHAPSPPYATRYPAADDQATSETVLAYQERQRAADAKAGGAKP